MMLWAPHGPLYDEDLFPEFGMDVQQFRRRFTQLATSMESSAFDGSDRELLEGARRLLAEGGHVADVGGGTRCESPPSGADTC